MQRKIENEKAVKVGTVGTTFYDFVRAVASERAWAARLLQADPGWLRETSSLGETALHYLAVENDVDGVRYLLSQGAAVDGAQESGTPLTDAAKLGYGEMVALLIEHGADLEARDLGENTPLLIASQQGCAEICDRLLAAGADVTARNVFGESVPDIAHPRKRGEVLRTLAKYGECDDGDKRA